MAEEKRRRIVSSARKESLLCLRSVEAERETSTVDYSARISLCFRYKSHLLISLFLAFASDSRLVHVLTGTKQAERMFVTIEIFYNRDVVA